MDYHCNTTQYYHLDMGAGYFLDFIATYASSMIPTQKYCVMGVLVDSNNLESDMVSFLGNTIHDVTTNVQEFLKMQRGSIVVEIIRPEIK